MEKYIYDNSNGLWYELYGDYYLPCLVIPEEEVHPYRYLGQEAPAIPQRVPSYALQ